MKKWIGFCIFAVCLFLNNTVARADVIWTPNDSFFAEYEKDCVYVHRCFLVNAPGGELAVQETPQAEREVTSLENGTTVWVDWTYTDESGILWGSYDGYSGDSENKSGWINMTYMDLIYDYISFEEDYGDAFVNQEGQVEYPAEPSDIYAWDYPGSPICTLMFEKENVPHEMPTYSATYEDEEGRTWAFCNYHYGWRNFWMCLDDVTADRAELYGDVIEEPELEINESKPEELVPERSEIWIGAAVGGVVIVTALVLVGMKKKMKKGM